jgi:hypothetical protein
VPGICSKKPVWLTIRIELLVLTIENPPSKREKMILPLDNTARSYLSANVENYLPKVAERGMIVDRFSGRKKVL